MSEHDDWDVDPLEDSDDEGQGALTYKISYYPADLTLRGYLDKHRNGQLVIPSFQRSYVWDQVKASKLIESFLLGLPVPGVFLYKERGTNKLQVIDGQQRILTAVRYFINDFDDKSFRLKNVHSKWNGKKYEDLDEADRYQLDDTVLRATVVQQLNPDDDSSVFHIFERLNTGGINLNPMEIRKCIYNGPQFFFLEELNKLDEWRGLIGQPKLDKRYRDIELILRVVALSHSWLNYRKPMKKFLNDYLASIKKMNEPGKAEFIRTTSDRITKVFKYVLDNLGEKPFHLRGRLNYAAMDSVIVAAIEARCNDVTDLPDRYKRLLSDAEFMGWATQDTSDDKILANRINRAVSILAR